MHHIISTNKLVCIGVFKVSVILFLRMKSIFSQLRRNGVGISNICRLSILVLAFLTQLCISPLLLNNF